MTTGCTWLSFCKRTVQAHRRAQTAPAHAPKVHFFKVSPSPARHGSGILFHLPYLLSRPCLSDGTARDLPVATFRGFPLVCASPGPVSARALFPSRRKEHGARERLGSCRSLYTPGTFAPSILALLPLSKEQVNYGCGLPSLSRTCKKQARFSCYC